jgi:hypothetical protein
MSASKQTAVRVDGEYVDIWVAKTGRVTWRAWGEFRGRHVEATGSSQSDAAGKWQQKADYISKE